MENKILNVLVAEDEPIILNSTVKKVNQISENIKVLGMAENGRMALELLDSFDFDVLITDIEMPGMTGLELIEIVKENYPRIKIIILSGYSNFEYARTAIKYGVEDYILKPVLLSNLSEILMRVYNEIFEEKNKQNREFLSMALKGDIENESAPHMFQDGDFIVLHVTIGNISPNFLNQSPSREYSNIWNNIDFYECSKSIPELSYIWVIDEAYPMQKFIIININEQKLNIDYVNIVFHEFIKKKLKDYPFFLITYYSPIAYKDLWKTAKKLRNLTNNHAIAFGQKSIVAKEDLKPNQTYSKLQNENQDILHNIMNETQYLNFIVNTLTKYIEKKYSVKIITSFINDGFMALASNFQIETKECQDQIYSILENFYKYTNLNDLIKDITLKINELLQDQGSETANNVCSKIKVYIDSNFKTKISLTDISQHFGYTPSYVNRIFKKEFSLSPVQYITNKKIEYAKKTLTSNPNLDIKTIALSIGYDDARYFSRVFKNETGKTPSKWIKENI